MTVPTPALALWKVGSTPATKIDIAQKMYVEIETFALIAGHDFCFILFRAPGDIVLAGTGPSEVEIVSTIEDFLKTHPPKEFAHLSRERITERFKLQNQKMKGVVS